MSGKEGRQQVRGSILTINFDIDVPCPFNFDFVWHDTSLHTHTVLKLDQEEEECCSQIGYYEIRESIACNAHKQKQPRKKGGGGGERII